MRKFVRYVLVGMLFFLCKYQPVYADEPIVVVIDPGHGGENLGAEYEQYTEKDMTMITANVMKEELEKYEGIQVYLTRDSDKDMSLEERVEFAESMNADFLYCLHYNMSVHHNLFGAEVWVSAFDEEYQRGYTFASIEIDMLKEHGLYSRGIKTKLGDGGEDYYGIIRHATGRNLTAVLIEHCHLDQENDKEFYTSDEKLKQFGRLDATAVAKYYGLKSDILKTDYSSFQKVEIPVPTVPVKPDDTEPDVCLIQVKTVDEDTGDVTVELSAQDYDSYILYYNYSYDGGVTFSDLQKWASHRADTVHFTMNVPSGTVPEIVVNAYNGFDGFTESNHVSLPSLSYGEEEVMEASNMIVPETDEAEDKIIEPEETEPIKAQTKEKEITVGYFIQISVICMIILFVVIILVRTLMTTKSRKKRRRRK